MYVIREEVCACGVVLHGWRRQLVVGVIKPQAKLSDSHALCHVCVSVNKTDRWRSEMEIMPEAYSSLLGGLIRGFLLNICM